MDFSLLLAFGIHLKILIDFCTDSKFGNHRSHRARNVQTELERHFYGIEEQGMSEATDLFLPVLNLSLGCDA